MRTKRDGEGSASDTSDPVHPHNNRRRTLLLTPYRGRTYRSQTGKYTARGYGQQPPDSAVERMYVYAPLSLLPLLAGLSGQTVVLAMLLNRQAQLLGWPVVRLPVGLCNLCGLNRDAVSRALRQLERQKLVSMHRKPGQRSIITVLWRKDALLVSTQEG